jgi:hypothetical protein
LKGFTGDEAGSGAGEKDGRDLGDKRRRQEPGEKDSMDVRDKRRLEGPGRSVEAIWRTRDGVRNRSRRIEAIYRRRDGCRILPRRIEGIYRTRGGGRGRGEGWKRATGKETASGVCWGGLKGSTGKRRRQEPEEEH